MNRLAAGLAALALLALGTPAFADQETDIGAQVYQQLQQKGEIIPRPNAMYNLLDPVTARIKGVADPQYVDANGQPYGFRFILVHEKQPNAFAVPGGNVYVTDSLMRFVKNQEELAGVICHETSHDIHHDVVNLNGKAQGQAAVIGILGSILGIDRSGIGQMAEQVIYTAQTSKFSRAVETSADLKGSDTCAQAGFDPYGLVWLFQAFEQAGQSGSGTEFLSDHPNDANRINALQNHFKQNPSMFARFSSDIATGTPLGSGQPSYTTSSTSSKSISKVAARKKAAAKAAARHSSKPPTNPSWLDKYNRAP
ncbi:MAG: M48 family metallopeptidase [Candidatus Eremiobacteraeota bacterium]|nr:M48 family metallopeptidase [Candidatus Eremiobacteraeota bacterium]